MVMLRPPWNRWMTGRSASLRVTGGLLVSNTTNVLLVSNTTDYLRISGE